LPCIRASGVDKQASCAADEGWPGKDNGTQIDREGREPEPAHTYES